MKQVLQGLLKAETRAESFRSLSTVFMIVLFLTFWGVSFYILVSSFS